VVHVKETRSRLKGLSLEKNQEGKNQVEKNRITCATDFRNALHEIHLEAALKELAMRCSPVIPFVHAWWC
jgi:hypothetical protein